MSSVTKSGTLHFTPQIGLSGLIGALFAVSPWLVDFGGNRAATAAAVLLGAVTVAVTLAEAARVGRPSNHAWALAGIAVLTLAAPWLLGATAVGQVVGTFVVAAVLMAGAVGWRLVTQRRSAPSRDDKRDTATTATP